MATGSAEPSQVKPNRIELAFVFGFAFCLGFLLFVCLSGFAEELALSGDFSSFK